MESTVAPHSAWDAAVELADEGHHVDYVAEGERRCLTGQCPPSFP
ncbi:hypothetical protein [Streptomyces anandii]